MKFIPTFVSVIALVWAASAVLRCDRLPWLVPTYVIAQCLFALIGFLGLQRSVLESRGYLWFFGVAFGAVLLSAIAFTGWVAHRHDLHLGVWLVVGGVLHASAAGAIVYSELLKAYSAMHRPVPDQFSMAVFQGAVLVFCGSVTLISLALQMSPELRVVTLALGSFWLATGILMGAFALGLTRNVRPWLMLNNWLPAMLALVAFAWMAFQLSKLQREVAHEALPEVMAVERYVTQ